MVATIFTAWNEGKSAPLLFLDLWLPLSWRRSRRRHGSVPECQQHWSLEGGSIIRRDVGCIETSRRAAEAEAEPG